MAPSLPLPLSTTSSSFSFSFLSLNLPDLSSKMRHSRVFMFSHTVVISFFSSCGGLGSQESKPAWQSVFLYFLPRKSLHVCVRVHPEVRKAQYQFWHKGPVTRRSRAGRGWAVWPCWILGLHYAFMFSLRCYVLSPGQLGHIFNGPFGWKTV